MPDAFDHASAWEQTMRDLAIAAQRQKTSPTDEGSDHCRDCAEPIPPARRAAVPSATRCIHCAKRAEKKGQP